jgi:hypothetical protein
MIEICICTNIKRIKFAQRERYFSGKETMKSHLTSSSVLCQYDTQQNTSLKHN